jgi:hypothetical protein
VGLSPLFTFTPKFANLKKVKWFVLLDIICDFLTSSTVLYSRSCMGFLLIG